MQRALSIDEIYEKVKGYDLVISSDIALVTALNSRISFPMVGYFAMTPRQIARLLAPAEVKAVPLNDLEIVSIIKEETGYSLRYVLSEVMNIRDIRRHSDDVLKYLNTESSRSVYRSYEAITSVERVMGLFDTDLSPFFKDKRVALVGIDFFDSLDKRFCPPEADIIEIFTDEEFEIDEIREIGNDRQIADNAVALIDPSKPDDYAIVLNASSAMADAVRAALYRQKIPFINRMAVRDMAPIRDYISFLTLSFSYDTVRVSQVKELFAAYNGFIKRGNDNFLLSRIGEQELTKRGSELREAMRRICHEGMTFLKAKDVFNSTVSGMHVLNILKDLRISDSMVTPRNLSDLIFAVDNIADLTNNEQTPENEKSGVLIADCMNSVYVDRPVVLYLGMEQDWNVPVVGKRYLDAETETDKNALRFEALIQQGKRRAYLVNTTKRGEKAVPCSHFGVLMNMGTEGGNGKSIKTFGDVCGRLVYGRWAENVESHTPEKGEEEFNQDEFGKRFSKSTYNNYRYCPRKFMYGLALSNDIDSNKRTEFGDLIHEFAEFCVCHRDVVDENGLDHYIDAISDSYAGISSKILIPLDRDRIASAVRNIRRFVDQAGIPQVPLDSTRQKENPFFREMGFTEYSSCCECDHLSTAHPLHGEFDLMCYGDVYDYKTGSPKSVTEIVKGFANESADIPEYQPLIYLDLAAELTEGRQGEFKQFYLLDNPSAGEDLDVRDNIVTIKVLENPSEILNDEAFLDHIRSFKFNKTVASHEEELIAALRESAMGMDPSQWSKDPAVIYAVLCRCRIKDTQANRKAVASSLKKIVSETGGVFCYGRTAVVPAEVLDGFLKRVDEDHAAVKQYYSKGFPAAPRKDCGHCDFRQACMKEVVKSAGGDSDE